MKAYLLLWNPNGFLWEEIRSETEWRYQSKQPKAGDLFFITAVGGNPEKRGIFCSGIVDTLIKDVPDRDPKLGKRNYLVIKEITFLANPETDPILKRSCSKLMLSSQPYQRTEC
ncbi:hypothetical protein ACYULU_10435 [Breznakiellaceae bacterium SP9]